MKDYDVSNLSAEQKEALLKALREMLEADLIESIRILIKAK